jgi:hypothetical protein
MIERTEERFGLKPERLIGDTAYGAAPMLNWLVEEKGIAAISAMIRPPTSTTVPRARP